MSKSLLLITLFTLSSIVVAAQDCSMSRAFLQPDEGGAKQRLVWADPELTGRQGPQLNLRALF